MSAGHVAAGAHPPPVVIVLSGLPFSGKSTLGRALARHLDVAHIELDAINAARFAREPRRRLTAAEWSGAYREGERRLRELLARGTSAIYDGVNYRWAQREKLRRLAREFGAEVVIVRVATPLDVIRRRRARNLARPERGDVAPEDFAEVAARFQEPRPGERTIVYDGSEPFAAWIAGPGRALVDLIPR